MRRSFEEPDEQKWLAGGRVRVDVVHIGEMPVKRVSHAPGWRWSVHSGPETNSERCPDTHVGLLLSGRLGVQLENGSDFEAAPGEVVHSHPVTTPGSSGTSPLSMRGRRRPADSTCEAEASNPLPRWIWLGVETWLRGETLPSRCLPRSLPVRRLTPKD